MSGAEWHWWNYLGVCIALIAMLLSVYPVWRRVLRFCSEGGMTLEWPLVRDVIAPLVAIVVAVGAIVGALIYLFTMERPSFAWTHPALSAAEQDRTKAECRMAAYDAIGGGRGGIKDPTPAARTNYVGDCLASKGFVLEEILEPLDDK